MTGGDHQNRGRGGQSQRGNTVETTCVTCIVEGQGTTFRRRDSLTRMK